MLLSQQLICIFKLRVFVLAESRVVVRTEFQALAFGAKRLLVVLSASRGVQSFSAGTFCGGNQTLF
jgi:hypothetical protein